jgi:hypothetical protein
MAKNLGGRVGVKKKPNPLFIIFKKKLNFSIFLHSLEFNDKHVLLETVT